MTKAQRSELAERVAHLRELIARQRHRGETMGEEDTKRVFVTPLLAALGWDVQDLEDVRNEYRYRPRDNPVDYALFMLRTPCLFVEAKSLNTSLDEQKWITQTISYAATAGVQWCVLTNGDEYRLYNANAAVDSDKKLFRAVRLTDEQKESLTIETLDLLSKNNMQEKRLTPLWNAHFVDRSVKAALEMLVREQAPNLVRLLRKTKDVKTSGLTTKEVRSSLTRADIHVEFPVNPPDPTPAGQQSTKPRRTAAEKGTTPRERGHRIFDCTLKDLIEAGFIKPPFAIEATWRKQRFTATVDADGNVTFNGTKYPSLSEAGGMARNIVSGPPTGGRPYYQTNGWTFWKYRDPETEHLENIDALRQRLLDLARRCP